MEEVFNLHDLDYGPTAGVEAAYDILVRSGRTPSLDYFETSWDWDGTAGDALEDMACLIEMQGGRARHDLIEKVLACHERDGRIHHTTDVGKASWCGGQNSHVSCLHGDKKRSGGVTKTG